MRVSVLVPVCLCARVCVSESLRVRLRGRHRAWKLRVLVQHSA